MKKHYYLVHGSIVFTDKENVTLVKKMRGNLPIQIIEKKHAVEKVKFVNEAIDTNPYKSDYFVWCDIESDIKNNFMSTKLFMKGRLSVALVEEFTLRELADKIMKKDTTRVLSNVQIGEIAAWRVYNEVWDRTRDDMIEDNINTQDDQRVMGMVALRYPELMYFNYITLDYTGDPMKYMINKYKD